MSVLALPEPRAGLLRHGGKTLDLAKPRCIDVPQTELLRHPTLQVSSIGRGKHTTRNVTLLEVAGGLLADTPGFNQPSLDALPAAELPDLFPEIADRLGRCGAPGFASEAASAELGHIVCVKRPCHKLVHSQALCQPRSACKDGTACALFVWSYTGLVSRLLISVSRICFAGLLSPVRNSASRLIGLLCSCAYRNCTHCMEPDCAIRLGWQRHPW